MRNNKPLTWGDVQRVCRLQLLWSWKGLPLSGSENPGAILIEEVSIYSHKGRKVTRFITCRFQNREGSQKRGCSKPGGGQSFVPSHQWAGDREQGSMHLSLKRWLGQRLLVLPDSNLSGHCQRCPRKGKAETCGGNSKLGSSRKCPDPGVSTVVILKNTWAATHKMAVFLSQKQFIATIPERPGDF